MKRFRFLATLMLCISSTFGTEVVLNNQQPKAHALIQPGGPVIGLSPTCTNSSLQGAFEIQGGGYLNKTQPYALNALDTFDSFGKVTGTVLVKSVAGTITTNIATKGTYHVKTDCSFTASFIRADGTSANYSGVVLDNGSKFGLTQTDPGAIVNLKGERNLVKP
ncbi:MULTISPECIES: hypothetical protein [unclassified Nostoc]|uniref:hypothetical protein n=1 Tax=unclassified Nostoc TaxID=2593658 RepID=UPI002608B05C|nr:hypothetical protein [Nostoc sp. S13]MDF5736402.1 hypothetical protein [Nostoc sp. S13]